jgi:hypothetical protein
MKARLHGLVISWLVLLGLTCAVGVDRASWTRIGPRPRRPAYAGLVAASGGSHCARGRRRDAHGHAADRCTGSCLSDRGVGSDATPGRPAMGLICGGAAAPSTIAQRVVGRVGPPHRLASDLHDYSWPFGHSTAAAAPLIGAALLRMRRSSQTQRALVGAAAVLGALTVAGLDSFSMCTGPPTSPPGSPWGHLGGPGPAGMAGRRDCQSPRARTSKRNPTPRSVTICGGC